MTKQVFFLGLAAAVVVVVALGVFGLGGMSSKTSTARQTVGEADIGGPFSLIDHNGQRVSDADFKGRYMLIFFGYTYCPDVCPTALQAVSTALDLLGDDAARIAPLFISVDPERDTAAVLKEFVGAFHPAIVGLTGSPDQVAAAARAYRAYYAKEPTDGKDPNYYFISHTGYLYLMGPDGKFLTAFSHQIDPVQMVAKIRSHF